MTNYKLLKTLISIFGENAYANEAIEQYKAIVLGGEE